MSQTTTQKNTGDSCAVFTGTTKRLTVEEFYEANFKSLQKFCRSVYNGNGDDVFSQGFELAAYGKKNPDGTWKRKPLKFLNFSLYPRLCSDAARELRISQWKYTAHGVVIDPPTDRCAERLDAHNAVAEADEDAGYSDMEIKAAKKMLKKQKKTGQGLLWGGA